MDLPRPPPGFRHRLLWAQRVGRLLLFGFVVAGLLGVWGAGGPLARQQRHGVGGGSLDLPRFARYATSFEVSMALADAPGEPRVHFSHDLLEHLRIESIQPQPSSAAWRKDGLELVFAPGTRRVVLHATPGRAGWIDGRVALSPGAGEPLQLWVHP